MKKFYFFFIVCLLGFYFLQAQTYHPLVQSGKVWSTFHEYCKFPGTPFSNYTKFEGDTTIEAYNYMKVWETANADSSTWHTLMGFIREDQKKIYFRYSPANPDLLIYDFGALPGDTMYLRDLMYAYVMDSTGLIPLLDGTQRRTCYVHSVDLACTETWIEGIGSTRGVLAGGTCFYVGDSPHLICFTEHDTIKYHDPLYNNCYIISGIHDITGIEVRIFPNPADESLNVVLSNEPGPFTAFEIVDMQGKIQLSLNLPGKNTTIRINKGLLSPGIYLYRIQSGKETIASGRITIL